MYHLKLALEKQIENAEGRKELLNKIAMANAKLKCKTILRALPLDTDPTIEQMVEACTKYTSTEESVSQAAQRALQRECQEHLQ